jgi:hypothetical protein
MIVIEKDVHVRLKCGSVAVKRASHEGTAAREKTGYETAREGERWAGGREGSWG